MATKQSKIASIALALLVLVSASAWYSGMDVCPARAQQVGETQLKRLLKERYATLKEVVDQTDRAYKSGAASAESMVEAEQAMFRAEVDLCESDAERIKVLEKVVVSARKLEEVVSALVKVAQAPTSASLKAKVNRLEAEIALERVRSK